MLWERHAKMESTTFVAIVFTILKVMDNEIVTPNHYVCDNSFDNVLFFSQQIISQHFFQQNCESTSTQKLFTSINLVISQKC